MGVFMLETTLDWPKLWGSTPKSAISQLPSHTSDKLSNTAGGNEFYNSVQIEVEMT